MTKKRKIIIGIVSAIVIIIIAMAVFSDDNNVEYTTAQVSRGDIVQTVSETGTVKAEEEINLSFLQSGRIASSSVKIGDKVKEGQILVELDYESLALKVQEAEANLEIAKANLNKLLAGATSEELKVSEASVSQAKAAYLAAQDQLDKTQKSVAESIAQAEKNLDDLESEGVDDLTAYEQAVITAQTSLENTKQTYSQSVYNKQDSALVTVEDKLTAANTALDLVEDILNEEDYKDTLSAKNSAYLDTTNRYYDQSVTLLATANSSLDVAQANLVDEYINQAIDDALTGLYKTYDTLSNCFKALENSVASASFTQTQLETEKSTINTQLTTINTAISSVQTAKQNLADAILAYNTNVNSAEDTLANAQASLDDAKKTAQNTLSSAEVNGEKTIAAAKASVDSAWEALQVAEAQYVQTKATARAQDIALHQAQVKQAEASLALAQKQVEDSIIRSPIDGTVVKMNYEIGEQVAVSQTVTAVLGENNFEIEIDISEADISKVKINDKAEITLDAFGDDIEFDAFVSFVEPAETIIQDVIYYKVTVKFDKDSERNQEYFSQIKSGMTANAVITTAQKENILLMPSRAVLERNGSGKFTRIYNKGEVSEVKIEVGLRGDEGLIEILSGVNEGDEVVTFVKEKE